MSPPTSISGGNGYWFLASEAATPDEHIELASIGLSLTMRTAYAETDGILPVQKTE